MGRGTGLTCVGGRSPTSRVLTAWMGELAFGCSARTVGFGTAVATGGIPCAGFNTFP